MKQDALDRSPVIVGIGEVIERSPDPASSKEPLDLMLDAIANAERDAGIRLVSKIDSIDVVKHATKPYADLAGDLTRKLGLPDVEAVVSDGSGNGPLREMHNAAIRIRNGETRVYLLCGGEAQSSVDRARKQGTVPPWMTEAPPDLFVARDFAHPQALKYGLITPAQIYPLYENAVIAKWGQTPREARAEMAAIWSGMSQVASENPYAWLPTVRGPEEIAAPSASNRLLAWPYVKLMTAMPSVNLASAVFMTSVAHARELGVPEHKLVYLTGGAAAREPDDYLKRDRYDVNASQSAVLQSVLRLMSWERSQFDLVEIYSCFPVVPRMARRILGLPADGRLTEAGGLTFFGAPLHNYMSHATCAMVRKLRADRQRTGLLYGQGGYVTKHHGLIVSGTAPDALLPEDFSVQAIADRARGPVPAILDEYGGPAAIETFTVLHDRGGEPSAGVILGRTPRGERVLARVPPQDGETIAFLKHLDRSPVGARGTVRVRDGHNEWTR